MSTVFSPAVEIDLLHRFEPVVRYTRGERFFPIDVERYLEECSLWVSFPGQPEQLLVPAGELTIDKLAEMRQDGFGAVYFVKFIDPLDLLELARYSINETVKSITHRDLPDVFHAGLGRLARVGYSSRLIDALFSISLLLRGRVPGDTAVAAAQTYNQVQSHGERYCYYGRVVQQNGWIVLQYWYFYPFNNWRSGFFGINDHEGDWEMICIYCSEDGSREISSSPINDIFPCWVAYASHDFFGDDLRRRWDDPEIEKVGEHPVIYSGAGSHASYYAPGEYLAELEIPFLIPVSRAIDRVQKVWAETLHQGRKRTSKTELNVFHVPFVDYARGDGQAIGLDQEKGWEICLLDPLPAWIRNYRGLWGLYARDPVAGENAPAGPMYNRDGTVRISWFNPVGWAGLDKVSPPGAALEMLTQQRSQVLSCLDKLAVNISANSTELARLGVEASAIQGFSHLEDVHQDLNARMRSLSQELNDLLRQQTVESAKLEAFDLYMRRLIQGDAGPLRSHIHRAQRPSTEIELRWSGFAEAFSALSIGFLMIGIVMLVVFARHYLLFGLAAMIGVLVFLESGFRRQLSRLVTSLTVGLAFVSACVLIFEFFWPIVVVLVLSVGLYIIWENFREIRG